MQEEVVATVPAVAEKAGWIKELIAPDTALGRTFSVATALKLTRVGLSIVIGMVLVGLALAIVKHLARKRLDARSSGLVIKLAQYIGFALIAVSALEAADIDLSALLGAAGIAGIALGFAAQTSVSNFISGFFLMSEKTFTVGDVVNVDTTTGVVYSIDTLSVKLRTFDNQLVRIPNETLIKANVSNITRFATRRLNIRLTISFAGDLEKARATLMEIAEANQGILRQPEPLFMVQAINKDGVDLLFGVWVAKEDWVEANNSMYVEIRKRFSEAKIPFAHSTLTVHTAKP